MCDTSWEDLLGVCILTSSALAAAGDRHGTLGNVHLRRPVSAAAHRQCRAAGGSHLHGFGGERGEEGDNIKEWDRGLQ